MIIRVFLSFAHLVNIYDKKINNKTSIFHVNILTTMMTMTKNVNNPINSRFKKKAFLPVSPNRTKRRF